MHIIARRCSAIHTKPQHVRYLWRTCRASPSHDRRCPGQRQAGSSGASLGPGPPLHSDKHVLCINKPGGLLTQPDFSGLHTATEAAKIPQRQAHRGHKTGWTNLPRVVCCFLLARPAKSRLAEQFAAEAIHKNYLAVVSGRPLRPGEANFIATSMRARTGVAELSCSSRSSRSSHHGMLAI